jgi:hypothetical protein
MAVSTFSVKPGSLRTYADTISGAATNGGVNLAHIYIEQPDPYVDDYVKIDQNSGLSDLFKYILNSNTTLVSDLHTTYGDIWPKLSNSGTALATSATIYQNTDSAVNEKMDRVWPGAGGKIPALDDEAGGGKVSDPSDPIATEPESEVLIPDPVHWIMDQAGWLSIGNDVLKVASIFGLDPAGLLTKAIAGDYSMVARAGHAAEALAEFERNTAQTIAAGLSTMQHGWTGNAADAATGYFTTFANAFDAHATQLDDVGNKYELIAQSLAEVATLLSGLLATAIDKLLICAASLASAGCLQAIPGVDVIADIIGAYEVWTTKEAVEAFVKAATYMTDTCEAIIGLCTGIAGACKPGTATTSFPKASYANGAQA